MTIATTTTRSTFLTTMASVMLFYLAQSASAAGLGQVDQATSKTMMKTESGLQYRDEAEGTGEMPKTGQTCIVHYTGWLWEDNAKGKKFDSSMDRNSPFTFPVGEGKVIKGWDEGVATMKVGGKRAALDTP